MKRSKFKIVFSEEADKFLESLPSKVQGKIIYNIDISSRNLDPKLFKKISSEIWYFRTQYAGIQYRLFAFWDKSLAETTLVITTHGIIKKSNKVRKSEVNKAERYRQNYFNKKK